MPDRNALLEAALTYADLGYAVFPCVPGDKNPLTQHGFLDATTDAARIEAWWATHPDANIGLSTAGLLVVDVDGADNPWPGAVDISPGAVSLHARRRHALLLPAAGGQSMGQHERQARRPRRHAR